MRLSELGGKEIVNLYDGERLGIIGNSDLVFDENTGEILYLIMPKRKGQFFLLGNRGFTQVAWNAIRKIGPDVVIIDMENKNLAKYDSYNKSKSFV